jgi:hypothetical protein
MAQIKAGVGRAVVTPRVGAELVGYFNRPGGSTGVHDDLNARALVIDDGEMAIALCSVELCWMSGVHVQAIREATARRCALKPENIFLFATHTHAGPAPQNEGDWDTPFPQLVADAIVQAYETRVDAKLAAGFGQLFGYNINRRWLNRPADPSVGVLRVDRADGTPLAVLGNYACHAVVMGYDNYLISGDWPGYASRQMEADLGHGCVVLFSQGGSGDVNPLTETVRQKLAAGYPVTTIGLITTYYGVHGANDAPNWWNIEDRGGGTFLEADTLARPYCAEVMKVWRSLTPSPDAPLWAEQVIVDGSLGEDEPPPTGMSAGHRSLLRNFDVTKIEINMLGIGDAILLGEPGEAFSENAVQFRKTCQQMGYGYPFFITHANGSYAYMPPENAFVEGGYEVDWALRMGISRHVQDRIVAAAQPTLERRRPT